TVLQRPFKGECFLPGSPRSEPVAILLGQGAQLAPDEMLPLFKSDFEPGVVSLQLPFPVERLSPETTLLLFPCPFGRAGAPPRPNQVVERPERFPGTVLGRRVRRAYCGCGTKDQAHDQ